MKELREGGQDIYTEFGDSRTFLNVLERSRVFWNTKGDDKDGTTSCTIASNPYKCQKMFLRTQKSKKCFKRIPRNRKARQNIFAKFWNSRTLKNDRDSRYCSGIQKVMIRTVQHQTGMQTTLYKCQKVFLRTKKVKSKSWRIPRNRKSEQNIFAKFWNSRTVKNVLFSGA